MYRMARNAESDFSPVAAHCDLDEAEIFSFRVTGSERQEARGLT
jgi:hypothetical protein